MCKAGKIVQYDRTCQIQETRSYWYVLKRSFHIQTSNPCKCSIRKQDGLQNNAYCYQKYQWKLQDEKDLWWPSAKIISLHYSSWDKTSASLNAVVVPMAERSTKFVDITDLQRQQKRIPNLGTCLQCEHWGLCCF